jgi:hypothetical protein
VLVVHIASVWVPFTSESKEAIAHYPEIMREVRLAIQECGRLLGAHVRRLKKYSSENKKRSYIDKYIPHIGDALQQILGFPVAEKNKLIETLRDTLERGRREMLPAAMRKAEEAEDLLKFAVESIAEKTKEAAEATIAQPPPKKKEQPAISTKLQEKIADVAKQTIEVLTLEPTSPKRKRSKPA